MTDIDLDAAKIETAQRRIKTKRDFPEGCLVQLNDEAASMFPRHARSVGAVIGYPKGAANLKIRWNHKKTPENWSDGLVSRVGRV